MSVAVNEARTPHQRARAATRLLRQELGLDDVKVLSTALAEAAAREVKRNRAFAEQVRTIYHELVQQQPPSRPRKEKNSLPKLVPIVPPESLPRHHIDPYGPPDPVFLYKLYGKDQLRLALEVFSLALLKEAAAKLEEEHPGTRPKSKTRRADLIDYIIETVAR
jgi:hypothetical protein